jgi:hypothetical protein|tara:strand:+ start:1781 stop:2197 length:417 start_codon:yes stop_codon:yes gene_type:complete
MIKIEFNKPDSFECECCGNESISLTRFVYNDGNAHAVYYAKYTPGHDDKVVTGIIGLGDWGDDAKPENRTAFPFRIWTNEENYQVGLIDKNESPWSDVELLGKVLDRKESLEHEWVKEVFHITDHIVAEDKEVIKYLN